MFPKSLVAASFLFLFACSAPVAKIEKPLAKADPFAGLKGCFLLYDMQTQSFDRVIGEDTCREQFPACSTFKVPLAVMAFDSGVLKDENQVLKWDGQKRDRPELDQDHNAKTWLRDSVVWFSQELTPKLGKKKFQKYLNDFDYGNKDISAGIQDAWLIRPNAKTSALKISAYGQVEFMKKLWTGRLPVSDRSMQLTRTITFLETSPSGFRLSGKTGSNFYDTRKTRHFGWFIAHLQKGELQYIAVTNISDLEPSKESGFGGQRAKKITKAILTDQGLW